MLVLSPNARPASGQQLELDAVVLTVAAESFQPALPSYRAFVAGAREPALFAHSDRPDALKGEAGAFATLAIDFAFRLRTTPHRFLVGFERSTLDASLFSADAADSTAPALTLEARNEYFGLGGGYAYQIGGRSRLSASAGVFIRVMIPVSAKTVERSTVEASGTDAENTFFARKSLALGASVPLTLGLRIVRSTDLQLTVAPGIASVGLDGSRSLARQLRTSVGLRFYLSHP